MKRTAMYIAGIVAVIAASGSSVMAQVAVPEIDGGSIASGVGFLAGSILILRARWRARDTNRK